MTHAVPEYTLEELEAAGRIDLKRFTSEDAFELGTIAAEVIHEWQVSLAVDIVIHGYLVYRARLGKTGAGNDQWLDGKAAVANHFGDSSLLVKLRQRSDGTPLGKLGVDDSGMKLYGGSIPLYVRGKMVATITTSGEADVVDHEVAAEAVARYLARK